jgi:hypothetical protein
VNAVDETYYLETIALLQEEIARLEAEARMRDDLDAGARDEPAIDDQAARDASRRIDALNADLAARDETITLLLEQVRLAEEAEEAGRAEWDQLNRWVQEVERRVEGIGGQGDDLRRALETERRRADDLARASEADRRSWDARRESLEAEAGRLRAALAEAARNPDAADLAMLETLEIENRRLRSENEHLARSAATTSEVETLREQLDTVRDELEKARQELRQALDDRQRERNEHEAALAALRSQAARESLKNQEEQVKVAVSTAVSAADAVPSVDDRIRALRLHLQDIHEREETERARKTLSARLSRLWHHTSPQR